MMNGLEINCLMWRKLSEAEKDIASAVYTKQAWYKDGVNVLLVGFAAGMALAESQPNPLQAKVDTLQGCILELEAKVYKSLTKNEADKILKSDDHSREWTKRLKGDK